MPRAARGRGPRLFAYNPQVPSASDERRPGARRKNRLGALIGRAGAGLDRAAFRPASLPDDVTTGLALLPPVVAGLLIFRLPAVEILAVALATGVAAYAIARWVWPGPSHRTDAGPVIAAVFGVALVGAGAGVLVAAEVAVLAVVLEVLRARYVPAIRAQAGLLAYAAIALVTRGAPFAYLNPATGRPFGDPISTWYHFFSPASAPVDPIRLYVGNVPGPVFATSLLAVAVSVAWLAYARRLSLVVILGFLLGALLAISTFRWDTLFQLDSGPLWFLAGLLLADRRLLPDAWAIRPALGFAAGLFAVGLRRQGYGIEGAMLTVAAVNAVMALLVVAYWSASAAMERWKRDRRLKQREANLRLVKTSRA